MAVSDILLLGNPLLYEKAEPVKFPQFAGKSTAPQKTHVHIL